MTACGGVTIVWFKRDLRIYDHRPLVEASHNGPVLPLYIVEPELWAQPDASLRQWRFLAQSLVSLNAALTRCGAPLTIVEGDACDVFAALAGRLPIRAVASHEETGNAWTFARDRGVARTLKSLGIDWQETPTNGVIRRLPRRDGWAGRWEQRMREPLLPTPRRIVAVRGFGQPLRHDSAREAISGLRWRTLAMLESSPPAAHAAFAAVATTQTADLQTPGTFDFWQVQPGGREPAEHILQDFLAAQPRPRIAGYAGGLSSPGRAWTACSRLSPYLTWGALSSREVVQASRAVARAAGLHPAAGAGRSGRTGTSARGGRSPRSARESAAGPELFPGADIDPAVRARQQQQRSATAFDERLHWRCHFVQKLESDPSIEFRNMQRSVDGLREDAFDRDRFDAWCEGRTGYPLIDASMRALRATGWLNFRMRAMLVSFAAYDLWLHWREPSLHLARLFIDYEPGIHYSQMQMQPGTTGINALRVYNPVKQSLEHDPQGRFIRRYLPELARLPNEWIHTPWAAPVTVLAAAGLRLGRAGEGPSHAEERVFPRPIVDHETAAAAARRLLAATRRSVPARNEAREVFDRHGSRRPANTRSWGAPQRHFSVADTTPRRTGKGSVRQDDLFSNADFGAEPNTTSTPRDESVPPDRPKVAHPDASATPDDAAPASIETPPK